MWFKRRNKQRATPPPAADPGAYVDLDRDVIPVDAPNDPTSLMFMLSMEHGGIFVDHGPSGEAIVKVGDCTFTGSNDLEALQRAWVNLGHTDK